MSTSTTKIAGEDMTDHHVERYQAEQAAQSMSEPKRGTDAQILFERELTCSAINGAMAFGYQNTNPPPSDDHWLAPFWKVGRKQAEMESALLASKPAVALGEELRSMLTMAYNAGWDASDACDNAYNNGNSERLETEIPQAHEPAVYQRWRAAWFSSRDEVLRAIAASAAPAQSCGDAYAGAREDLAIWKKRALEAEALNRKFMDEINGPTHMGEPHLSCGDAEQADEAVTDETTVAAFKAAGFHIEYTASKEEYRVQGWLPNARTLLAARGKGRQMNTTNHTSPSGEELKPCPFCGASAQQHDFYPLGKPIPNYGCGACNVWMVDRDRWQARAALNAANGGDGEREAFEAWFSDNGQYLKAVERSGDGYKLSSATAAWATWQARAALTAKKVAQAEPFPYQRTFDAIAAATSVCAGRVAISVIDFRKAFAAPQPAQPAQGTLSDEQCKAIEQAMAWAPHGSQCQSILRALLSAHNGGKHE